MSEEIFVAPPDDDTLARLYHELASRGAPCTGREVPWPYSPGGTEELMALAAQLLRYDARLLAILLQFLLGHWDELDPLLLRRALSRHRWPQALLVVFSFARLASREPEIAFMAGYVSAGFARVSPAELFFIDTAKPGGRESRRSLGRNLQPYARWGFIGTERPISDSWTRRIVGRYDAATRRRILRELVDRRGEITISEYLDAIDGGVSRQQALTDLQRSDFLVRSGSGRGARWVGRNRSREPATAPKPGRGDQTP